MKYLTYYYAILGIVSSILLILVLNTTYEFTYCCNNVCTIGKQKIFDYVIGRN